MRHSSLESRDNTGGARAQLVFFSPSSSSLAPPLPSPPHLHCFTRDVYLYHISQLPFRPTDLFAVPALTPSPACLPPTPPSPPFPNLSASSFTLYLSSSHSSACLSPQDTDWPAIVQGCPPFSWFVPSPCFVTTDKDLEQVSVTNVADLAPAHFGTSVTPKKFDYTARAHAH